MISFFVSKRQENRFMFTRISRALISVSDKLGLLDLARALSEKGVEIVSTGGTAKLLRDAGLVVRDISDLTGFPEMLDGRVKTLHPKVHGGLLGRRDLPAHQHAMAEHSISPIDLVVVNLYPFESVAAKPDSHWDELIENIDIGGPSMIRSAAKNHESVIVLSDPTQYPAFLQSFIESDGGTELPLRKRFALEAFQRTASYDAAISQTLDEKLNQGAEDRFPSRLTLTFSKVKNLRYGENPQQKAAFYLEESGNRDTASGGTILHGKELSYNNLLDLDAAIEIVRPLEKPAACVVKHNNPCGVAMADTLDRAYALAFESDPVSAFGGIIGLNRVVDAVTATLITEPGRFFECIIAEDFTPEALEVLTTRPTWKNSVRLVKTGKLTCRGPVSDFRKLNGGLLVQGADEIKDDLALATTATIASVPADKLADLKLAWHVVRYVKSNAIVLAKDGMIVGVGAGQMSRVDSVQIALRKAGEKSRGAVLASDAFFPFRDNVDLAAAGGIIAIAQPGGSVRDKESIEACDQHKIAMVFTGVRHFRH